jgi:stage III sporulation protein SpoIIIAA
MTEQERRESIHNYLTIAKPHSEEVSSLLDQIRVIADEIKEIENNPVVRARLWSEISAMFAGMSVRELGGN